MMGKGFYCEDLDDMYDDTPEPKFKLELPEPDPVLQELMDKVNAQIAEGCKDVMKKFSLVPFVKNGGGLSPDDIVAVQPMTAPTMLQFGEMKLSEDGTKYIIPIKFQPPIVPSHIMLNLLRDEPEQLEFPFVTERKI